MRTFTILAFIILSLFQVSAQELTLERIKGIGDIAINKIYVVNDNEVWTATQGGLFRISDGMASPVYTGAEAYALTSSPKGVFAGLEENHVVLEDERLFTLKDPSLAISCMAEFNNKIWIGTNDGVFTHDLRTHSDLIPYSTRNTALESNHINFIHADMNNNLWIGTNSGLVRINDKGKWKNYDSEDKMVAITENKEGVWLLSEKDLYLIDENNRWYPVGMREGLYKGRINDIIIDANDKLYVASDILTRLDPYSDEIIEYSEILGWLSKEARDLEKDSEGNIYFGTKRSGVYKITIKEEEVEPEVPEVPEPPATPIVEVDKPVAPEVVLEKVKPEPVRVKAPSLVALAVVDNEISCAGENNASVTLMVQGGAPPYQYEWSDASISGENPKNMSPGDYSVKISDSQGQVLNEEVIIKAASPIKVNVVESQAISKNRKKDGFARVDISGGTAPLKVTFDNGEKGLTAENLKMGEHTVTVTDGNGCTQVASFVIDGPKLLPGLDIANVKVGATMQINNMYYPADSVNVDPKNHELLNEVFDFLDQNDNLIVEIGGHTNGIPSHEYCDDLSTRRAKSIADYLYEKGIPQSRLKYKGYGKRKPVATNETVGGRKKNQRVEVKVLEIKQ